MICRNLINRLNCLNMRPLVVLKRFKSSHLESINAIDTPQPGHVHAKRPFKYNCKANRVYMWCTCGWSRTQPFCDGTHANPRFKIKHKPLRFECNETKEYWFCQCKQTKNRPFCDGSHKLEEVQALKSTINSAY